MNPIEHLSTQVGAIESELGYAFCDKEHLILAFVHRSFCNEHREISIGHNERLEFLGDSVLGLIVSAYLYQKFPQEPEGSLSHLRSHLVGAEACAQYTERLRLEPFLLLGKGESANKGRGRRRILADLFEAIIGALYLDGGWEVANQFFLNQFSPDLRGDVSPPFRNWKAELQNYSQKKIQKPPTYHVIDEVGPSHSRVFIICVAIDGVELGRGEGASKKLAEQMAAEDAMRQLERVEEDGEREDNLEL